MASAAVDRWLLDEDSRAHALTVVSFQLVCGGASEVVSQVSESSVQFHDTLYTMSQDILYTSARVLASAEVGCRCHGKRWTSGISEFGLS